MQIVLPPFFYHTLSHRQQPMENYQFALQKLCRLCGEHIIKFRVSHSCADHKEELWSTFSISIDKDIPDIHPLNVCDGCHVVLRKKSRATKPYLQSLELF